MVKRFQFVWWFPRWSRPRLHRWEGDLRKIYRYSLILGWLEIRRWENP